MLAREDGFLADVAEDRFEAFRVDTDANDGFTDAVSRSPEIVVVVSAYGPGQAVTRAEEVHGPGLPVIPCEDTSLGAFVLWEFFVDSGHGRHHLLPADPVG